MPAGKPAGVACAHLLTDLRCGLFGDPRRPDVCERFQPEPATCGAHRHEAMALLGTLERQTAP
jgi:isochorismate synthase EntC